MNWKMKWGIHFSPFRVPPSDPRERRFRRRKQEPYQGYHDRMSGNYFMDHNKIVDQEK